MAVEALRTDFLKPTVTAIERAIQLKGVRKQASVDNNTPAVASPPGDQSPGESMSPARLNALTDGVVAIVMTIMVLELKFPAEPNLSAVMAILPLLGAYLLAFVNVAIFWNNHHHMMQSAHKVTGAVLWANHALLFCLTLFPLMIRWIDEAGVTPWPVASFGVVLVAAAVAYQQLEKALMRSDGDGSIVKRAVGAGSKEWISFALYLISVPAAFVSPYISVACFVIVSVIWVIPDRRFERELFERKQP